MRLPVLLCLAYGFVQSPTWADQVHLSNGRTIDGVVIRESASQVVLQVAWEGHVVLDRTTVTGIERSTDAQREELLAAWRREHEAFQERERREREFEAEQLAKGLVFHRGEWITREELAVIKERTLEDAQRRRDEAELKRREDEQRQRAQELQRREEELTTLTQRLRAMQEEQLRLQQEIIALRSWLARPHLVVRHAERFVTDEHGNLLRVLDHAGHLAVVTPDGSHADLQVHDGHLSFTDRQGVHHDVTEGHR
jgi:hypothetical protein